MSQTPPPPPTGGYGAPPPPPPGSGPAGEEPYSVGNAVSYGWSKFQANAGQIILAGLVVFVGIVVFEVVGYLLRGAIVSGPECTGSLSRGTYHCTAGSGFFVQTLASAIMAFLFYVIYQVIGAGIIRGALGITEGRTFQVEEVFKTERLGAVILTSLLTSAIIFVGTLLCFLPGLIASFFLSYAMFFVVGRGMEPLAAIGASVSLVMGNLGEALLWAIVAIVIVAVGFILCGVGLIVAVPVSLIGTAYTFQRLTGRPIAP